MILGLCPSTLPLCPYFIDSVSDKPLPVSSRVTTHAVGTKSLSASTKIQTGFDCSKKNTRVVLLAMHAIKTTHPSRIQVGDYHFKSIRRWLPSPTPRESRTVTSVRLPWTRPAMWSFVNCGIDVQTHLRGDQRTLL